MELTATTILVAFAGVFLICFMKGAFGGGFAIVGIPLLSIVMDPVTAGGLLAPLFIAMDLFSLRYWKPSTWSRPDLQLLVPGLVVGIGAGYLLFRVLDHRAIAILMAVITLVFVGLWFVRGGEVVVQPRSPRKAVAAGRDLGDHHHGRALGRTAPGDLSAAARLEQAGLCGHDQPVLHGRQPAQGGPVADAGQAGGRRLEPDGDLPAGHPLGRLAGVAPACQAGSAPDVQGLLRLAGGHRHRSCCGMACRVTCAEQRGGRSFQRAAFNAVRACRRRPSRLHEPAPNATICSRPPAISMFFRKWNIWFWSPSALWKNTAETTENAASAAATRRVR